MSRLKGAVGRGVLTGEVPPGRKMWRDLLSYLGTVAGRREGPRGIVTLPTSLTKPHSFTHRTFRGFVQGAWGPYLIQPLCSDPHSGFQNIWEHKKYLAGGFPSGKKSLPVQETWVQSVIWEDIPCLGAPKPTCHNYWAHMPWKWALHQEKPPQSETHTAQLESSPHSPHLQKSSRSHEDPAQPKIVNFF